MSKIMTAEDFTRQWIEKQYPNDDGVFLDEVGDDCSQIAKAYAKYYAQSLIEGLTDEEAEKVAENYDENQYDGVLKARQYYLNRLNQEG